MEIQIERRDIVDDIEEDLDVCKECTGTWKVACYGAWNPRSQFWDDFLEDGWDNGVNTPQACCLRFMCGMLFCFLAPVWCCKAILFFLCWPCICGGRALKHGQCNKTYFRVGRAKEKRFDRNRRSDPLAYIETARPAHPNEIQYQISARNFPPDSPIPEIRIETEQENGTYLTSPVDDTTIDYHLPASNGRRNLRTRTDLPPAYPTMGNGQPHRTRNSNDSRPPVHSPIANGKPIPSSSLPMHTHSIPSKSLSTEAKGMDNNLYPVKVRESFQGITGKVTSV